MRFESLIIILVIFILFINHETISSTTLDTDIPLLKTQPERSDDICGWISYGLYKLQENVKELESESAGKKTIDKAKQERDEYIECHEDEYKYRCIGVINSLIDSSSHECDDIPPQETQPNTANDQCGWIRYRVHQLEENVRKAKQEDLQEAEKILDNYILSHEKQYKNLMRNQSCFSGIIQCFRQFF